MPDRDIPTASRLAAVVEAAAAALLLRRPGNVAQQPERERRRVAPHGAAGDAVLQAVIPERLRGAVGSVVRNLAPVLRGFGGGGWTQEPLKRALSPEGGRFVERAFANAAGSRDYKVFVPSCGTRNLPLVVMLHGCGQSPDDFAAGTAMNARAEAEGFVVVYPGQSARAHGQRCWNWYQPGDQARESGEAGLIAGITRAVAAEHAVDPRRIYIAGLSAGAAAAANVARAYPDLYAALGLHSGLAAGCATDVTSALTAMRLGAIAANGGDLAAHEIRVPTIVFHGENDGTVHPRNGDQILAQAGVDALTPTRVAGVSEGGLPYERTRYADAHGHVLVENWTVRGLAHAWSGGDPSGSYTDRRGPDASRAMLEFFRAHSLAGGAS